MTYIPRSVALCLLLFLAFLEGSCSYPLVCMHACTGFHIGCKMQVSWGEGAERKTLFGFFYLYRCGYWTFLILACDASGRSRSRHPTWLLHSVRECSDLRTTKGQIRALFLGGAGLLDAVLCFEICGQGDASSYM